MNLSLNALEIMFEWIHKREAYNLTEMKIL